LGKAPTERSVEPATFGRERSRPEPEPEPDPEDRAPAVPAPRLVDVAPDAPDETHAPSPAGPQTREALSPMAAAESLRLIGARLAEQARSDSLEIAFSIARRILEAELSASPEPLFAMVRSAVRRVGDAREVVLKVSPASAALVEAQPRESLGLTMARVSVVADPSLQGGDCIVESDLGTVDGRLGSRLEELRRALAEAIAGDAA